MMEIVYGLGLIYTNATPLGGYIKGITVEDSLPLAIFNGIFGVTPSCKLFQNVREKAGLAYTAKSQFNRMKSNIFTSKQKKVLLFN